MPRRSRARVRCSDGWNVGGRFRAPAFHPVRRRGLAPPAAERRPPPRARSPRSHRAGCCGRPPRTDDAPYACERVWSCHTSDRVSRVTMSRRGRCARAICEFWRGEGATQKRKTRRRGGLEPATTSSFRRRHHFIRPLFTRASPSLHSLSHRSLSQHRQASPAPHHINTSALDEKAQGRGGGKTLSCARTRNPLQLSRKAPRSRSTRGRISSATSKGWRRRRCSVWVTRPGGWRRWFHELFSQQKTGSLLF